MDDRRRRRLGIGLAGLALAAGIANAGPSGALAKLQPGQWQLKEIGATGMRTVCLADPATVLQLGHGNAQCTRSVIENGPTALTVRYVCPGAGHGRSTLTVHAAGSFRLQTQGIAGGAPFDFDYEAKRTGDCAGAAPAPTGR